MASYHPLSVDNQNNFEDLSGAGASTSSNPYDALIEACDDDPKKIQERYAQHCQTRNKQQKSALLDPSFTGLLLDPILQRLEDPEVEPGFEDPRHCLVFWARPPKNIRQLVEGLQENLLTLAPHIWLMPLENLHMTALEITHSLTAPALAEIVAQIKPLVPTMVDYPSTLHHRARLIRPMLSVDKAAVALSFLPAAPGDGFPRREFAADPGRKPEDDAYTYHHLRRDLFNIATCTNGQVDSRYVVPSAHITIARFITQEDHDTQEKMKRWIDLIDDMNKWLVKEWWTKDFEAEGGGRTMIEGVKTGGEWIIGENVGLECRQGKLWYGGGTTIALGKGIPQVRLPKNPQVVGFR